MVGNKSLIREWIELDLSKLKYRPSRTQTRRNMGANDLRGLFNYDALQCVSIKLPIDSANPTYTYLSSKIIISRKVPNTAIMYSGLFIVLLGTAYAAPSGSNQPINPDIGVSGAFEVPIEWEVQAFPDGQVLKLNGTVQKVHEQLLRINPNYDADFHPVKLDMRSSGLSARTDFSNTNVVCDPNRFGRASVDRLGQGINYLRGLKGQPRNGGGPGACGQVSCSYGTGIWWCNDVSKHTVPTFNSVTDVKAHSRGTPRP